MSDLKEYLKLRGDEPVTITGDAFIAYLDKACAVGKNEGRLEILAQIAEQTIKIPNVGCNECLAIRKVLKDFAKV